MVPESVTTPATVKARRVVNSHCGYAGKCTGGQASEVMVTGSEIRMIRITIIPPARKTDAPISAAVSNQPHSGRRFFRSAVIWCVLTVMVVIPRNVGRHLRLQGELVAVAKWWWVR